MDSEFINFALNFAKSRLYKPAKKMENVSKKDSPQKLALELIREYLEKPTKAIEILSSQFYLIHKEKGFSRFCQFIFLSYLRNRNFVDCAVSEFCSREPKKKLAAAMRTAATECLMSPKDKAPKIVDSWVDYVKNEFSKKEAGFLNAFLRKFFVKIDELNSENLSLENLAKKFGHPTWLVERWIELFGFEKTLEILKTSQLESEVFFRKSACVEADEIFKNFSEHFNSTEFENFFALKTGRWDEVKSLLSSKFFYIQDPSTSFAPKLLNPQKGKKYLDLCSAPGGKSRMLADLILSSVICDAKNQKLADIVCVDFGARRMKLLKENLSKVDFLNVSLLECDLSKSDLKSELKKIGVEEKFDAVFLDAPCSNSGVLRRRPDARWRISIEDIFNCKKIQLDFLDKAANLVKDEGNLVYSTCSIDPEENEKNVDEFISTHPEFVLIEGKTHFPTKNSDGCGAFLLKKSAL